MTYRLGAASRRHLVGVHPDLVRVVEAAIGITAQDFTVMEGRRSAARQIELYEAGYSRVRVGGRHVTGHAVDLVPWRLGEPSWSWPLVFPVAHAMQDAARALNVPIRWGGVWDRRLNELGPDLAREMAAYHVRHVGPDLADGPHFELPAALYPDD